MSSVAVCVSIKNLSGLSLEFGSFFKYLAFSLSKSVLLFRLNSKFLKREGTIKGIKGTLTQI